MCSWPAATCHETSWPRSPAASSPRRRCCSPWGGRRRPQGIWRLVAELHRAGIAHRDLRLANLFLDDRGQAWLIDFGFGTVAALPQQLAGDVAELLCSMAAAVGPRRTSTPRSRLPVLPGWLALTLLTRRDVI